MAEFTPDFHSFTDTTMGFTAKFPSLNPKFVDSSMNLQSFYCVSSELFYDHQPTQNLEISDEQSYQVPQPNFPGGNELHEKETVSWISTTQAAENGIKREKLQSSGKCRKVKNIDREEEKPGEIVHVRARRGQATDSHSLAERVRREKINERLRCLQDIVPGCYKQMGMAVMLDEIINYVQSLQNQVEFLSMKLAAASSFNEYNSETMVLQNFQRAKAHEAEVLESLIREGCLQSAWPF